MHLDFEDEELHRLACDAACHTNRWSVDATRLYRRVLNLLEAAMSEQDLQAFKVLRLEQLKGPLSGTSSVRISSEHGLIVRFTTGEHGHIVTVIEAVNYGSS